MSQANDFLNRESTILLHEDSTKPSETASANWFSVMFHSQVVNTPEQAAVLDEFGSLSYRELAHESDALANHLGERGIGRGSYVAVAVERNRNAIIALLAVLKAGAAYLPLDLTYPRSRVEFMLSDSSCELVIVDGSHQELKLPGSVPLLHMSDWRAPKDVVAPKSSARLKDPCYIIYTSGSTGTPKGIAMSHMAAANLISWQISELPWTSGERTLQFSPLSFDVHFQEIFSTLCSGGTLVMIDEHMRFDTTQLLLSIKRHSISRIFLPFVALQSLAEAACSGDDELIPQSLHEVITAGEQLQITRQIATFFEKLPHCRLHNHYGPSETHVATAYTLQAPVADWPSLPPIGWPIQNVRVYLLDTDRRPVPDGEEGEIYIAGPCLAIGYLGNPEQTEERFVPDTIRRNSGERMYRTGDLGKRLPGGSIVFLGRLDGQVKVRGYRVELGEIELALASHSAVAMAAASTFEVGSGNKKLVGYMVLDPAVERKPTSDELRSWLGSQLPDYMIPSSFVFLDRLPRTPSGKVDRRALPLPPKLRPELTQSFVEPASEVERTIAEIWAKILELDRVGLEDNLFDLGATSLSCVRFAATANHEYGLPFTAASVFEFPSVKTLVEHHEQTGKESLVKAPINLSHKAQKLESGKKGRFLHFTSEFYAEPIAIVGMACRFPGASTLEEFWQNLASGRESIHYPKDSDQGIQARGLIDNPTHFDPTYFGLTPREAEFIDPQQRLLLELCAQAIHDSGYDTDFLPDLTGVYVGVHNNTYYQNVLRQREDQLLKFGAFQAMLSNEKDYAATRVAHCLNLRGPAVSINTACSTSLVAVVQAVQSLRTGQCKVALAGGAAITFPREVRCEYEEGSIYSPDGKTRPFDKDARGTVFSDGGGVVVLKRLTDARAHGDRIYATIKGVALNNDGGNKAGFGAPSVEGQSAVISAAMMDAGVSPEQMSYIEAHGTATPIGDPIEIRALSKAFSTSARIEPDSCVIGSVKGNIGHLTTAAGIAGLIKTCLALTHKLIPATVNYAELNPEISLDSTPFRVSNNPCDWMPRAETRLAGVSSFGIGGTNAHVVVEEFQVAPPCASQGKQRPSELILASAHNRESLERFNRELTEGVTGGAYPHSKTLAYSSMLGRNAHPVRSFHLVSDTKIIRSASKFSNVKKGQRPNIVFMFPGQGAQYPGMSAGLYKHHALFRRTVDQCADIAEPLLQRDLRELIYPKNYSEVIAEELTQTQFTQPALFIVEYALARMLQGMGIEPQGMLGHSSGELVCALLAEVFDIETAVRAICTRALLMADTPAGRMLAVRLSIDDLQEHLSDLSLSVAAENAHDINVLSGDTDNIVALQDRLIQAEIPHRLLFTSRAFHSPLMNSAAAEFESFLQGEQLHVPKLPFISCVTGDWISEQDATSPRYWAKQILNPVKFSAGVSRLLSSGSNYFLELGPGRQLTQLVLNHKRDSGITVSALLLKSATPPAPGTCPDHDSEWHDLLHNLGELWQSGCVVDWHHYFENMPGQRCTLPSYPFSRVKCEVTAPEQSVAPAQTSQLHQESTYKTPAHSATDTHQPGSERGTRAKSFNEAEQALGLLTELFEDLTGIAIGMEDAESSFIELGMDSLTLTQAALRVRKEFGVDISFRDLMSEYSTPKLLAEAVKANMPVPLSQSDEVSSTHSDFPSDLSVRLSQLQSEIASNSRGELASIFSEQAKLMQMQLEILAGTAGKSLQSSVSTSKPLIENSPPSNSKFVGVGARIQKTASSAMSEHQRSCIAKFTELYVKRTATSKAMTERSRSVLADPRVVSGFKPELKELIYPIVVERSEGPYLWDVDGNQYIDITCGFGSNMFGFSAPFIVEAVQKQMSKGMEIGPQHPLTGRVAQKVAQLTGLDRVVFCNTGSEAVLGAIRSARTVTGRDKVVVFEGAYHGIIDEVIVRSGRGYSPVPAAPGIPQAKVDNLLVLEYGTDASLAIIREKAHELAAVLVEPVQSRRPDFQPVEFLREVRKITHDSGSALIFDEVITGFRTHPGGAQALFGIRADLGTYGKVVGGGLPIGVIAGSSQFMDAFDGGSWRFGDDSVPEVGVTYFAGTFVRHPLALAAADVVLTRLLEEGPGLQQQLSDTTSHLIADLNDLFTELGAPLEAVSFGSLFKVKVPQDVPYAELLFQLLRHEGLHVWDHRPCFLTTSHSRDDLERIKHAFRKSVTELMRWNIFESRSKAGAKVADARPIDPSAPPLPGARLGKDPSGQPAWYVPHPELPGKFIKVSDIQ